MEARVSEASSRVIPDAFGSFIVYKFFFNKINKLIFLDSDLNTKIRLPGYTLKEIIMKSVFSIKKISHLHDSILIIY